MSETLYHLINDEDEDNIHEVASCALSLINALKHKDKGLTEKQLENLIESLGRLHDLTNTVTASIGGQLETMCGIEGDFLSNVEKHQEYLKQG
ncbi:MAG: hypothetical protein Q9M28_12170, partial [Mariprofundaceae bacterium]|nr:hypothetical protein [Mariprofundaceae bacterium]